MASTSTNRDAVNRIRKSFCDSGQGHLFDWWDELSAEERDILVGQLEEINLELMARLSEEHLAPDEADGAQKLEPAPVITIPATAEQRKNERAALKKGEEIIRAGKTAVFLVAGGQSSRLGLDIAKGRFPIMPVTGHSLFQHHAEKVLALSRRYGVAIPFFVMTSQTNHQETVDFFEENDFFGLSADDVFFLTQGMLPAVDFSGKFVMKSKGALFMSPDGHGGALGTIARRGALEEMEKRGIKYLFYFQVDNPLVKILDPVFLGYHALDKAEMSSKVVEKTDPEEKVGVLGKIDGKLGVIEYSDLDEEEMHARNKDGRLKFSAGSIAIHLFNVDFITRFNEGDLDLPYHKAEKKIPLLDDSGEVSTPEKPNGVKFETFIFDAIQYAKKSIAMEVSREEEFAPVKNAVGTDSPETSRAALTGLFRSWLAKAGFAVDGDGPHDIEISPLFALDEAEFVAKAKKRGLLLSSRLYIQ